MSLRNEKKIKIKKRSVKMCLEIGLAVMLNMIYGIVKNLKTILLYFVLMNMVCARTLQWSPASNTNDILCTAKQITLWILVWSHFFSTLSTPKMVPEKLFFRYSANCLCTFKFNSLFLAVFLFVISSYWFRQRYTQPYKVCWFTMMRRTWCKINYFIINNLDQSRMNK